MALFRTWIPEPEDELFELEVQRRKTNGAELLRYIIYKWLAKERPDHSVIFEGLAKRCEVNFESD